jgi:hypothetical protein
MQNRREFEMDNAEIRMECVRLVIGQYGNFVPADRVIKDANELAEFVISGTPHKAGEPAQEAEPASA